MAGPAGRSSAQPVLAFESRGDFRIRPHGGCRSRPAAPDRSPSHRAHLAPFRNRPPTSCVEFSRRAIQFSPHRLLRATTAPPTLEPVLRRTVSRGSTAAHTISGVRWQNFAAARERNHCRHAGAHQLHSHSPRADPRDSTSRWLAKNSRIEVLGGCPRYSRTAQRFPSVSGSIHNSKTPLFQPLQITSTRSNHRLSGSSSQCFFYSHFSPPFTHFHLIAAPVWAFVVQT